MKISIVIPNYNGEKLLKKNIPLLIEVINSSKIKKDIIIVDDCSQDNSVDIVKTLITKFKNEITITLIENEKNLGFSSTANIGVEKAEGDIIVLLNTDVVPEKNFLLDVLVHFKDENVFAVGCLDKSIEGRNTVLRGRGLGRWSRGLLVHWRGDIDKKNTLWVSGGSGFFRRSVFKKIGGFYEIYNPFYWEDIDLSYRALKSGYEILFDSKITVAHTHEEGAIKNKYSCSFVEKTSYRNQILFSWINIKDANLLLFHIFWIPFHLLKAIITLNVSFLYGFFEALLHLKKVFKLRNKNATLFIESDEEVISKLLNNEKN